MRVSFLVFCFFFLRAILAGSQHFYVEHFSLLLFSKYSLITCFSSFCFRKWLHPTIKSVDQASKDPASFRHSWACLDISSLSWLIYSSDRHSPLSELFDLCFSKIEKLIQLLLACLLAACETALLS